MWLIAGLGNPGRKYEQTRHNAGFLVVDRFLSRYGSGIVGTRFEAQVGEVQRDEERILLLKPQTFMNESGRSIRAALDWFDLSSDQVLVLVDDMDLPLGRLRLRAKGSAGGHNGLKSTIQHLGTQEFARLRIGIGAPGRSAEERRARTVSHVLGSFHQAEQPLLKDVLDEVLRGVDLIQRQGLERAGNRLNGLNLAPEEPA